MDKWSVPNKKNSRSVFCVDEHSLYSLNDFSSLLKVDLLNGTVVDRTLLPGAGRLPVYSLNPNTYLDMAVDELGLWVIHADLEYGGNLVITKLDKGVDIFFFLIN